MSTDPNERRRERRARQTAAAAAGRMRPITCDLPIYELLNAEGLERLHQASMRILSEFGIDFYDEDALAILKAHGADVRGETVFFDPALIAQYVALAPHQFTQLARNPANNVVVGGNQIVFAPVYGPPFVLDLDRGRREATLEDFENFVKLAYLSPYIHHSGGTIVEPTDEPVSTRHLDMLLSHIKYSDKAFMGSVTSGGERRRQRGDGRDRVWGRGDPGESGADLADQRQQPAPLRRPHAERAQGLRPRAPGADHHAVHPGRRDGADRRSPARWRSRTPRRWPALRWRR